MDRALEKVIVLGHGGLQGVCLYKGLTSSHEVLASDSALCQVSMQLWPDCHIYTVSGLQSQE